MVVMTIYRFAFLPKYCDKCGRLFWLERYEKHHKLVGIEDCVIPIYICRKCLSYGNKQA